MRAIVRAALIAATLLPFPGMAQAAEIRVLAVQALETPLRALAAEFAKDSGHQTRADDRHARQRHAEDPGQRGA